MPAKRPNIKKDINEAQKVLRELMQEHLAGIASAMIAQIMSRARRATPSTMLSAIKDVATPGLGDYKGALISAMGVVTADALSQARREVPKAKSVQLAEFEDLPAALQRKLRVRSALILDTQIADLQKSVFFQFNSSWDSTDSVDLLQADLEDAAEEYIGGASVYSASSATAAGLVNTARNAFFIDEEVASQLDAFVFTNGDPVSPICQDLAGTVFSSDDPNLDRYWPPLHWNCKSYVLPILKGNLGNRKIEKLKPTKTAEASIQFSEKCTCGCSSEGHGESNGELINALLKNSD